MMYKLITLSFFLLVIPGTGIIAQSDRDSWQQPEKIMDVIGVKPGMVIAEAGAGRGYFTLKLAARVGPDGKIIANDINPEALRTLEDRAQQAGLDNIVTIFGETENPLFPFDLDMAIMVYVFSHLDKPLPFLENIKPKLKPGARLVIVDGDPDKYHRYHFFFKQAKVVKMITSAGWELVKVETFLPRDNIYIFKLPGNLQP